MHNRRPACTNNFGFNLLYTAMVEDLDHYKTLVSQFGLCHTFKEVCLLICNVSNEKKRQAR